MTVSIRSQFLVLFTTLAVAIALPGLVVALRAVVVPDWAWSIWVVLVYFWPGVALIALIVCGRGIWRVGGWQRALGLVSGGAALVLSVWWAYELYTFEIYVQ